MGDFDLHYRSFVQVEDLAAGECTIHRARGSDGARFWLLWLYVARDTDGQLENFAVPVLPGGVYTESGPGGRSWGLTDVGGGAWQVAPSINALQGADAKAIHAGAHPTLPSLWHHTPRIVGVPAGEPWTNGGAP